MFVFGKHDFSTFPFFGGGGEGRRSRLVYLGFVLIMQIHGGRYLQGCSICW